MSSEFPQIRLLQARSIKLDRWSFTTSNIKEYIQGCISVLFSYKIGNVFRSLQGRSSALLSAVFWSENSSNISQLQELVNNFFILFSDPHNVSEELLCCCAALFQRRDVSYHREYRFASTFFAFFIFNIYVHNK